ncbi:MAG: class I SAM-dependent methyltransferase [Nitrososphaerota archaeon]
MNTVAKPSTVPCKICRNSTNNRIYQAREMMFGMRDTFTYLECSNCLCVQLVDVPVNLDKYYPSNYYSVALSPDVIFTNPIKSRLGGLRTYYGATNRGVIGRMLYNRKPDPHARYLLKTGVTKASRILDVGCGTGIILYMLRNAGFSRVMGLDPFIPATITYKNGLTIHKQVIHAIQGNWDVIMFHHSFEHVPDPLETLASVSRLLAPGGTCLIRVPTSSSYAWDYYRTNWIQLDAPRHTFLHSIASMNYLASQVGLMVDDVIYDSTAFQFWGSEQYARDIPLDSPQSYKNNPIQSLFTPEQIAEFSERATVLNQQKAGDQAAFYLRKA